MLCLMGKRIVHGNCSPLLRTVYTTFPISICGNSQLYRGKLTMLLIIYLSGPLLTLFSAFIICEVIASSGF